MDLKTIPSFTKIR